MILSSSHLDHAEVRPRERSTTSRCCSKARIVEFQVRWSTSTTKAAFGVSTQGWHLRRIQRAIPAASGQAQSAGSKQHIGAPKASLPSAERVNPRRPRLLYRICVSVSNCDDNYSVPMQQRTACPMSIHRRMPVIGCPVGGTCRDWRAANPCIHEEPRSRVNQRSAPCSIVKIEPVEAPKELHASRSSDSFVGPSHHPVVIVSSAPVMNRTSMPKGPAMGSPEPHQPCSNPHTQEDACRNHSTSDESKDPQAILPAFFSPGWALHR